MVDVSEDLYEVAVEYVGGTFSPEVPEIKEARALLTELDAQGEE